MHNAITVLTSALKITCLLLSGQIIILLKLMVTYYLESLFDGVHKTLLTSNYFDNLIIAGLLGLAD